MPSEITDLPAVIANDPILLRIVDGETPSEIAKSLNLDKSAISHRYKGNEAYRLAREVGMEYRLDTGLEAIRSAESDLNLARAREAYLRRLEWRAEKEFPDVYGAKAVAPSVAVQVNITHSSE